MKTETLETILIFRLLQNRYNFQHINKSEQTNPFLLSVHLLLFRGANC